jgi:predicted DNA-binding transcriptional regulator AlpA
MPQLTTELPTLMNQKELAAYLGKSIAWCERSRWAGDGPKFIKLGRHVRYRISDVLDWINENVHESTSDEVEI